MTKMKQTEKYQKVVAEAIKRFQAAYDADEDERSLAMEDEMFAFDEDGQWDDLAKQRRRGKPRYTINQVAAAINETVGNYRQNQIMMKALPEQDQSKEEADTYNGLMRAILSGTNAETAKDTVFKGITVSGFGAARVRNAYSQKNPFEQDIEVDPIYNALETVWFDPKAQHMTAKDGMFVFESTLVPHDEFEERWPEASIVAWPDAQLSNLQKSTWGCDNSSDGIRVADYYVKEPVTVEKVMLSDGSIMVASDYEEVRDELEEKEITFVDAKVVKTYKVMCYKLSGTEVLEEPTEMPTCNLPIIRCLGYHEWRQNCLHYRGIVRNAKDPQRVYNYATSANVEAYALAPKQKVMATKKMMAGHERTWRNLNNSDTPVLTFTPDAEAPDGKPIPFNAVGGSPELVQQAQQAQMDVQATIGRRSPAQGETAMDRSGRAILALQRQDDAVTFELLDNLSIFWQQVAEVAMDMIPIVYDTERQFMILGDDGQTEIVTLNYEEEDEESGKKYRKYDTSRRYRLKASVGAAFETKRSETVNVLQALMQDPEMKPLIGDLFAKNLDFPMAEEMTKRIRKQQLANGFVEPTDDEIAEMKKQAQTPEGQAAAQAQQLQQQIQEKQLALQIERSELENANLRANIGNIESSSNEKATKNQADMFRQLEELKFKYAKLERDTQTKLTELAAAEQNSLQEVLAIQQGLKTKTDAELEEMLR